MSGREKKALAIGAGILIVLILLFLLRRGGAGAAGSVSYNMPAVYGPQAGPSYHSQPVNISIPGLDLSGPDLSMIGACCSDCMQSNSQFYQPQFNGNGTTYVFNAAANGPNIYNIGGLVDSRHDGISGDASQVYAATGSYFYNPAYGI